jgi:hypothetical protein
MNEPRYSPSCVWRWKPARSGAPDSHESRLLMRAKSSQSSTASGRNRRKRADRGEQRAQQPAERAVVDGDHVLRRHAGHQVEYLAILAEQQDVQRGFRVTCAQQREHRLREHQAAHLRKQDHDDAPRWRMAASQCGTRAAVRPARRVRTAARRHSDRSRAEA